MSPEESFRAEWAMAFDVHKEEVLPCFCYELTREWLRDARRRRPEFDLEKLGHPVWGCGEDNFWLHDFDRPYLVLNEQERRRVGKVFPSYYNKSLPELIRESITARKSAAELAKDVAYWGVLHEGQRPQGRAALIAQLRTNLRMLGAYRVLQKYKWNNNPTDIYHSMREWNKADKRARQLIASWFPILFDLLRVPRN